MLWTEEEQRAVKWGGRQKREKGERRERGQDRTEETLAEKREGGGRMERGTKMEVKRE